jgi:hypothetical protein
MLCIGSRCGSEKTIRWIHGGGGAAMVHVSWIENTDSKGANDIETRMLLDNLFFTSFVRYSATINMESNITYMVQGTSKSVVPSTINKSGLFPFHFRSILLFSAKISSTRPFSFNLMVQEAQP